MIFILLILLTVGSSIVFLPLFILRCFLKHHANENDPQFMDLGIVFLIIALSVLNFIIRTDQTNTMIDFLAIANVYIKSMFADSISYPILYILPYTLLNNYWFIFPIIVFIYLIFTLKETKLINARFLLFSCFFLSLCMIQPPDWSVKI